MPRLQVLLAALCFGTTGTAQALGPDGVSPLTVGAVRVALGAALLLLAVRLAAGSEPLRLARRPLAVGGLGVAGYQLCFFAAVHDTGVAVGTVAALGSAPAFAGLGGWLVNRTKPGSGMGGRHGARGRRRGADGAQRLGRGGVGAGVVLALGAVPTALAYILFARGLRLLPASEVATLTLAEPVTAAALGALVLGERPGAPAVAGIALVIAGLAMLALRGRPQDPVPAGEGALP